ncbi:MAG: hypothetical protein M1831_004688 [Alyxoria varia]|nr:MAG: hypothetical protein M1831_004688 [Alyxoria varia]
MAQFGALSTLSTTKWSPIFHAGKAETSNDDIFVVHINEDTSRPDRYGWIRHHHVRETKTHQWIWCDYRDRKAGSIHGDATAKTAENAWNLAHTLVNKPNRLGSVRRKTNPTFPNEVEFNGSTE